MKVFAKFDEIPSRTLQDIKETKRQGHTFGRTNNVKTVYPPTNTVCGGYNERGIFEFNKLLILYLNDVRPRSRKFHIPSFTHLV